MGSMPVFPTFTQWLATEDQKRQREALERAAARLAPWRTQEAFLAWRYEAGVLARFLNGSWELETISLCGYTYSLEHYRDWFS